MVKVGDIVKTKNKEGKKIVPAVVTKTFTYESWRTGKEATDINVLFADGDYGNRSEGKYKKTGRSIAMQSVLDAIEQLGC